MLQIPTDFRFPDTARLPTHKVTTFIVQLLSEKVKQQYNSKRFDIAQQSGKLSHTHTHKPLLMAGTFWQCI
jgi:hypothetical protein